MQTVTNTAEETGNGNGTSLSVLTIEELLIGLVFANFAAFAIQDFWTLFLYKTLRFVPQSTKTAFLVFIFAMLLLFTYMRLVPKGVVRSII